MNEESVDRTLKAENEKTVKAPYVAFKTFEGFLDRMREKGLPDRIDQSVFKYTSGGTASHLRTAISLLRLIDKEGKPTELFRALVSASGEEKSAVYARIFDSTYRKLIGSYDLTRLTALQMKELLGGTGSTSEKAISFFISFAKEAQIEVSPHLVSSIKSKKSGTSTARKRSKSIIPKPSDKPTVHEALAEDEVMDNASILRSLKAKIDLNWPKELREEFYDAVDKLRIWIENEKKWKEIQN